MRATLAFIAGNLAILCLSSISLFHKRFFDDSKQLCCKFFSLSGCTGVLKSFAFFTQISIEISFFWTSERLRISISLLLSTFGWSPTKKRKSKDFLVCLFPSLPCSLIHLILALLIEIYLKILSSSGLLLNFLIATIASLLYKIHSDMILQLFRHTRPLATATLR